MKALFAALGEADRLEPVIMQLVHVVERGERAQMSKRKGEFVTLDELIDDIGVDAARFFLLQRSHDTPLDLDLDLARERSQENPVYYVQYAHARIASILRNAGEERVAAAEARGPRPAAARARAGRARAVKRLLELPDEVREAAERRRRTGSPPTRTTSRPTSTPSTATAAWSAPSAERWRTCAVVCLATQRAIARVLDLLGVEAPEQM